VPLDEIQRILQGIVDRPPDLNKLQDVFLAAAFRRILAGRAARAELPRCGWKRRS